MRITYEEALNRIAEVTKDNRDELRKSRLQRRTEFTDLNGVPFFARSDDENKAQFYISISPDLVYFLRFQFKLHIKDTTSDDFTVKIHGVDLTDYLIEQQDGDWIDGEGVYPTNKNEEDTDYYDVLSVATLLYNGDDTDVDDANKLLKSEFKLMEIESDAPFEVTMYLYCKYSVVGR